LSGNDREELVQEKMFWGKKREEGQKSKDINEKKTIPSNCSDGATVHGKNGVDAKN